MYKLFLKEDLLKENFVIEKIIPTKNKAIWYTIAVKDNIHYFIKSTRLKSLFKNDFLRYRMNKELDICNKIKSNSIYLQKFYYFFYSKKFANFVYEYFPKGNIELKYNKIKFSVKEVLIIVKDIYLALEELKKLNIYHKCLSIEFIFLNKNNFKLGGFDYCDFSKSLKYSEINHSYLLNNIVNINTIPPELIFNKFTGSKTVYFSLGVIIYYLILKKYLFKEATFDYWKLNYLNNNLNIKYKYIPNDLHFIITNCLQVNYNTRISSTTLKEELNFLFKNFTLLDITNTRRNLFYEKTYLIKNIKNINDLVNTPSVKLKSYKAIISKKSTIKKFFPKGLTQDKNLTKNDSQKIKFSYFIKKKYNHLNNNLKYLNYTKIKIRKLK